MNAHDPESARRAGGRVRGARGVTPRVVVARRGDPGGRPRRGGGRGDRGHRHPPAHAARCASRGRCGPRCPRADLDAASLVARVREPPRDGRRRPRPDRVHRSSRTRPATLVGPARTDRGQVFRVAAYDFGIKRNILRLLADAGMETTVFPARTPAAEVAAGRLRRRLPVERARRPRRHHVRGGGLPRAARARSRCSASAWATNCWAWRWAAAPTRCRSATAG